MRRLELRRFRRAPAAEVKGFAEGILMFGRRECGKREKVQLFFSLVQFQPDQNGAVSDEKLVCNYLIVLVLVAGY